MKNAHTDIMANEGKRLALNKILWLSRILQ